MKKISIEIKWALIFILMQLLWMTMEKLFGYHDKKIESHYIVTMFIFFPAIAIYVFALLDKKKKYYSGKINGLQAFGSGLIITLIVTILSPLSIYLSTTYISPDFFNNMIQYTVDQKIKPIEEASMYFNLKNYIKEGLISTPIMGAFTSGVIAIFVKSKKEKK